MYRIYLVEDDTIIARSIKKHLENWEYEVQCTKDFSAVTKEFAEFAPQLVLMDIGLPFYNGYYWCGEIRKISKVPIIFLSSAADNMNIVMAVNMGADDFIAKPYNPMILLLHMEAVFRRASRENETILQYKELQLDLDRGSMQAGSGKTDLTKNESRILAYLIRNQGKIVSRDELIRYLWESDEFVDDNTLTVNITRIRKKLEECGMEEVIKTKRGQGYILG